MNIKVCLERATNAKRFGVPQLSVVDVDLETYVAAVVASEIGNAALEACKAQAVAARTYALYTVKRKGVISDLSDTAQAFRIERYDRTQYPNALLGAEETAGQVLTYDGDLINALYSESNGGRTYTCGERWGGGDKPYLIARDDLWDAAAGERRRGHGVGMSQRAAVYAAKQGVSYEEILYFYYPGTKLEVMNMVQAADLIRLFHQA